MPDAKTSNFWLDQAADEIVQRYPDGEIVVSSGISPSASYHIGHFREIMMAEALAWAVRKRGRTATHIHVVDNFDPLRTWYDFLPPAERDYSGWPVAFVPDPIGDCHASYADHFYAEFEASLKPIGIQGAGFKTLKSYEDLYRPNHMTPYIEAALEHVAEIKAIFKKLSNRDLPADWTPVSIVGEDKKFHRADLETWDKQAKTLGGHSYENGGAKLDWRLDWPARWVYLGVNVEPFGAQEHGAAGGSYDTASQFAREVFHIEPPYGKVRYGHIHKPGENFKISSSKGNGISPLEALKIMPAEVIRYFIVRSRPENKIYFDRALGLYNLIDEFAAASADANHPFRDAYNFAVAGTAKPVISTVPFKHLVQVYQAAQADEAQTLAILARTGYANQVKAEHDVIVSELNFVKNWLATSAPEEVKFSLQQKRPDVQLSDTQRGFLTALADSLQQHTETTGESMHKLIYDAAEQAKLEPKLAFHALYRIILGKDFGPKAGWFLASLDRSWLIKRLQLQA